MNTNDTMMQEIARLRAENETLKVKNAAAKAAKRTETLNRPLTCKVSQKGAVSVYGLGRFPVTLYGEQWDRLIAQMAHVHDFIKVNKSKLAVKGTPSVIAEVETLVETDVQNTEKRRIPVYGFAAEDLEDAA